jgi:hypothetical protein
MAYTVCPILMDEKNQTVVRRSNASFDLTDSGSFVMNPRISSNTSVNNHSEYRTKNKNQRTGKLNSLSFLKWMYPYFITSILTALGITMFSYIFKSEDPFDIISEIELLREQNKTLRKELSSRNLCAISEGTMVVPESPLYKHGFMKSRISNPDALMTDSNECSSFEGQNASFSIVFKRAISLARLGIYHPPDGNLSSPIKEFSVQTEESGWEFVYQGHGYQEFPLSGKSDKIRIIVKGNHGEERYTSIYRVFVFQT